MENHTGISNRRRLRKRMIKKKEKLLTFSAKAEKPTKRGMLDKGKIHDHPLPKCAKTRNKGKKRLRHGNYYKNINYMHRDMRQVISAEQAMNELQRMGTS